MASKRVLEVLMEASELPDSDVDSFLDTAATSIGGNPDQDTLDAVVSVETCAKKLRRHLEERREGAALVANVARRLARAPALSASFARLLGYTTCTSGPEAFFRDVLAREGRHTGHGYSAAGKLKKLEGKSVTLILLTETKKQFEIFLKNLNDAESLTVEVYSPKHADSEQPVAYVAELSMNYVWPVEPESTNARLRKREAAKFGRALCGRAMTREELTDLYASAWLLALMSIDGLVDEGVPDMVTLHLFTAATQLAKLFGEYSTDSNEDLTFRRVVEKLVRDGVTLMRRRAEAEETAGQTRARAE